MVKDLDKIIGQRIDDVRLLIWSDGNSSIMIEKILFEFNDYKFVLQVNSNTDEIIPQIINDFKLEITEKEHQIINSEKLLENKLNCLIGKQIIWLWTMTNNQGYFDAIQIEIEKQETYQFLTIGSQIEIRKVIKE